MLIMKLTKNNLIKKLGIKDEEVIKVINDYKDKLPILSEECEGFCVNARDLHRELVVNSGKVKKDGTLMKGKAFGAWIKERIEKYDLIENIDYTVNWFKDDEIFDDSKKGNVDLDVNNINQMVRYGYNLEYNFNIDTAKQLAMVENNEIGKIARRYFIEVEKALKLAMKWNLIRKPERERYKELCEELKQYFIRNFDKEPQWYDYSNEADALNNICLGAKAKKIQKYIDMQDKNTRDWLEIKYNEYLDQMQLLDIMYIKMNFDKERRYDLIRQGFKALYPNASFVIAEKIEYKN